MIEPLRHPKSLVALAVLGACSGITDLVLAQSSAAFPSSDGASQSETTEPVAPRSVVAAPEAAHEYPDPGSVSVVPEPAPQAPSRGRVLAAPYRLPYEAGDPVPPGYRVEARPNHGLAIGGGTLLGVAYVASLVGLVSSDRPGQGWLAVPVVGPFGALLTQEVKCNDEQVLVSGSSEACSTEVLDAARRSLLLLVDGLFQVTGATLLVVGLSTGDSSLVRDMGSAGVGARAGERTATLNVSPRLTPSHYGLAVSGSF